MKKVLLNIRNCVLESAGWKTFFSIVIPIFSGVFSGTFIIEITNETGINWRAFYKAKSFFCLLFIVWVIYFYNKAIYIYEREINRFRDKDFCLAYMRSKCLPEAAEKYKKMIRDGEGGELKKAMDETKRILK